MLIIEGRRIRNLDRHLGAIRKGADVVVGVSENDRFCGTLRRAGFSDDSEVGDAILPSADLGPVSRYNAEGKHEVLRDQPMETAHRMAEWHWTEWHGRHRVPQSGIVYVPYRRYPRRFLPPPSVEFRLGVDTQGHRIIHSTAMTYTDDNRELILHTVNLYLEAFGECNLYSDQPDTLVQGPLRRLNWTVLPRGRMPWEQLRRHLEPVIERTAEGNQPVIRHRLETVARYGPEFTALGRGGFDGYVIFGFPDRRLYICESRYTGNATYVFGQDWETLSRMTKAEILSDRLQKARLIHCEGWERQLARVMHT